MIIKKRKGIAGLDIRFMLGVCVFLGVMVILGGMVASDLPNKAFNVSGTEKPPVSTGDILVDIPAFIGYMVGTVFGMSSDYAFILAILIIPIIVTVAYILAKLVRGN